MTTERGRERSWTSTVSDRRPVDDERRRDLPRVDIKTLGVVTKEQESIAASHVKESGSGLGILGGWQGGGNLHGTESSGLHQPGSILRRDQLGIAWRTVGPATVAIVDIVVRRYLRLHLRKPSAQRPVCGCGSPRSVQARHAGGYARYRHPEPS